MTEILNLNLSSEAWFVDVIGHSVSFNTFVHAAILPSSPDSHGDLFSSHRPLLGILMSTSAHSAFFVYSLKTHQIIQRIALPGIASTFQSNNYFIVIVSVLITLIISSALTQRGSEYDFTTNCTFIFGLDISFIVDLTFDCTCLVFTCIKCITSRTGCPHRPSP